MAMIEVCNLRKSYGDIEVLRDVSFSVDKGEVVVVLGPSGSGKSTMLRCINLLEEFEGGEIRIAGEPIGYLEDARGVRRRRREAENAKLREQVGMVFQKFYLIPTIDVLDNVAVTLLVRGIDGRCSIRRRCTTRRSSSTSASASSSAAPGPGRFPHFASKWNSRDCAPPRG